MNPSKNEDRMSERVPAGLAAVLEVLPAYLEKSPVVQAVIQGLLKMVRNEKGLPEQRRWAEGALQDALFRHRAPEPGKRRDSTTPLGVTTRNDSTKSSMCV